MRIVLRIQIVLALPKKNESRLLDIVTALRADFIYWILASASMTGF